MTTPGIGVSVASVAMGATVIEKHFTLSRKDGGVDSAFSIEPHELQALVTESKRAKQAIGSITYGATSMEERNNFSPVDICHKKIKIGELFTPQNLRIVRPGDGAPPNMYESLIGRTARQIRQAGNTSKLGESSLNILTKRLHLQTFQNKNISDTYLSWLNDPVVTRYSNQRFCRHTYESSETYLKSFVGTSNSFLLIKESAIRCPLAQQLYIETPYMAQQTLD